MEVRLEGLGPGVLQPSQRGTGEQTRPQNQLIVCFSLSGLLFNPLLLLVKTNTHSLTPRCSCWLNAPCSRHDLGGPRLYASREGRRGFFLPRLLSSLALFSRGAGVTHMWLRHSPQSSTDLCSCSSTVPNPSVLPYGSCYSCKPMLDS